MKRKMTYLRSLMWSVLIWKWLADHPLKKGKDDCHPATILNVVYGNDCALCVYTTAEEGDYDEEMDRCTKCPMYDAWPSGFKTTICTMMECDRFGSAYERWDSGEHAEQNALILVKAFEAKIEIYLNRRAAKDIKP